MLGIKRVNIHGYADDLVIFARTVDGMKVLLERIEKLIYEHELSINVALNSDLSFDYRREQIEIVDEYKYLGINIQSNLLEESDINRVTASFNKSVRMLCFCALLVPVVQT